MTAGKRAWLHAMVAADQFEDGSLVIQNRTLSVDGGGAVNLLVKLGAKPRSDVTVALSETSALISLGVPSLVFTPENWDRFQSVTVTGEGNTQSWTLGSGSATTDSVSFSGTDFQNQPISGGLLENSGDTAYPVNLVLRGTVNENCLFYTDSTYGSSGTSAGPQMSSAFETSGQIHVSVNADANGAVDPPVEITVAGPDALGSTVTDDAEPYSWRPSNSAELTQFHSDLTPPFAGFAGTLILRDYVPADAVVSLAVSAGPSEYTSVSADVTVSVS